MVSCVVPYYDGTVLDLGSCLLRWPRTRPFSKTLATIALVRIAKNSTSSRLNAADALGFTAKTTSCLIFTTALAVMKL